MRGFIYLDVVGEKKSNNVGKKGRMNGEEERSARATRLFLFKKQSREKSAAL